jgi:hypothetical protein
MGKMEV